MNQRFGPLGIRGNFDRRRAVRLLVSSILVTTSSALSAQTASQVLPPTREEVTRPETPLPQSRAPRLQVEGEIERAPCALDSPDFKDIRFTLRNVVFEGLAGPQRSRSGARLRPPGRR